MRRIVTIIGSVGFLFLLSGCDQIPTPESANRAVPRPVSARAVSRHYVELTFDDTLDEAFEDVPQYAITDPAGIVLLVHEAKLIGVSRTKVILRTDAQAATTYELRVAMLDGTDPSRPQEPITFLGSTSSEVGLETAVPLASDKLLVLLRSPGLGTPDAEDFAIDDLDVLAVSDPSDDGLAVTLSTSQQEDRAYSLSLTSVPEDVTAVLDPLHHEVSFVGIDTPDTTPPTIRRVRSVSSTTVLVEFSEQLQDLSNLRSLFWIVERNSETPLTITGGNSQFMNTHVMVTTSVQRNGVEYVLSVADSRRVSIRDVAGNTYVDPSDPAALNFIHTAAPPRLQGSAEPRLVGAISTGNTTVEVVFNKAMSDRALEPANYSIVTSTVQAQAAGLQVSEAQFQTTDRTPNGPIDRSRVLLTTLPQSTVEYKLTTIGLFDVDGNALGPPRLSSEVNGLVIIGGNETTFAGTGESGVLLDSDGDGLLDAEEQIGWVAEIVFTRLAGEEPSVMIREVTSDPFVADTDGDLLTDGQEYLRRSDPRDLDTDNDQLPDFNEFHEWGTSLTRQDSDKDGILDAREVNLFKTSPRFADTDGDGLGDNEEVLVSNRDPRLADLPLPGIEIGEVALRLDTRFSFTNTQGQSETISESTSTTLSQSESTMLSTTDVVTNQHVAGGTFDFDLLANASVVNVKAGGSYTYTNSHVFTTSESSTIQSQEQYQESLTTSVTRDVTRSVTRTVEGASVEVLVTINDQGDIPFTVRNLELTGLIQDPFDRTTFEPLTSLLPASVLEGGDGFEVSLGPLIRERGPFIFKNTEVFPSLVEDLMKSPRGLTFVVANYDIVDEAGRNFAFTTQQVNDRTAGLVIDYGNGTVERHRISTHSPLSVNACSAAAANPNAFCRDDEDCPGGTCILGTGRPLGILMRLALQDILGLQKNESANAITVGPNECAETSAIGDDIQVKVPICPPVTRNGTIIEPGPNGVLETVPVGDDQLNAMATRIVDGGDGCAHTRASRDDVQVVPGRCESAGPDGIVVRPGPDNLFQTSAEGDDELATVTGYETELRGVCDGLTFRFIDPGPDGVLDSRPVGGDDQIVSLRVIPGPNGTLETAPRGDDQLEGPGASCRFDTDCPGNGRCKTVERLVRVKGVKEIPDEARFWVLLSPVDIPPEIGFDDITMRSGDFFTLAFVQDKDGDGLSAREEFLYGSSDRDDNSDGCPLGDGAAGCDANLFDFDSLLDFDEVREGWRVSVEGQPSYFAFPNPVQPDTDADRLFDDEELAIGSDPGKRDTDDDEISDVDEVRGFDIEDRAGTLIRRVVPYQSAYIGAGADGELDSTPVADDQRGMSPAGRSIITAGCDGILNSTVDEADVLEPTKLILDGGNGISESTAQGDDVQVCPDLDDLGCPNCPPPSGTHVVVTFLTFDPGSEVCDADESGEVSFAFEVRDDQGVTAGTLIDNAEVAPFAEYDFDPADAITVAVAPQGQVTISGLITESDALCDSNTSSAVIEPPDGNGLADTLADGDDDQVRELATPVSEGDIIVSCGPNGQLDTLTPGLPGVCPVAEKEAPRPALACEPAIGAGLDDTADTLAQGDDEQIVDMGTEAFGVPIIAPGPNGVIDSAPLDDDELIPAFVPLGLECSKCPLGDCVTNCALCPTGACTGDDVILARSKGDSCEDDICPCGACVADAHLDIWDFTELVDPNDIGVRTTITFDQGPGCFGGAVLTVRIDVLPGSEVDSGSVVVRPGPNGALDTEPEGDDFVGVEHLAFYATDPLNRDSDGDTLFDGTEKILGANPSDPLDASKFRDNDLDGLANIEETEGWFIGHLDRFGDLYCRSKIVPQSESDCDGTDSECFIDVINSIREGEPNQLHKFLLVPDSSNPPADCEIVTSDRFEPDTDFDGIPDLLERLARSDPRNEDTDSDGLLDLDEFDLNSTFSISVSASRDFQRRCSNAARCTFETEPGAAGTSIVLGDTDRDGLDDRTEVMESFVINPCIMDSQGFKVVSSDPLSPDADRDGVTDGDEKDQGTDPRDPDTDDDDLVDNPEIDCQPTGCGTLVSVQFVDYFAADNCEPGGKAELRFNLRVVHSNGDVFHFNYAKDNVDDGATFNFMDMVNREFQLGEGESFRIAGGRVFEDDGPAGYVQTCGPFGCCCSYPDEVWRLGNGPNSRKFTLATIPASGEATFKPNSNEGDSFDSCFGSSELKMNITTRIGTAGCPEEP